MDKTLENLIKEAVLKEIGNTGKIPIGISARHLHITKEHFKILFGKDELTPMKTLMGGQFASEEKVLIIGNKMRLIENVRILGPFRKETQVEVSKTDGIKLALNPPVRESGDLEGSAPITIVGPKGIVKLEKGLIVAMRHIHMNEEDANRFGLKDREVISVKIDDGTRGGTLNHVLIRVDKSFTLEMHIDTDEANALGITPNTSVLPIKK